MESYVEFIRSVKHFSGAPVYTLTDAFCEWQPNRPLRFVLLHYVKCDGVAFYNASECG